MPVLRVEDLDVVGGLASTSAAEVALSNAAAERGTVPTELLALVLANKAELLLWSGDVQAARHACSVGISEAQAPGCEPLLASCLGQLALIEATQGCLRRASELANHARAVAETSGSCPIDALQAAEVALAWVGSERDDTRSVRQHVKRAAAAGDAAGPAAVLVLGLVRARLLRRRDPNGAARTVQEVRASFAGVQLPWWADARLTSEETARPAVRPRTGRAAVGAAPRPRDSDRLEDRLLVMQARLARGDTSTDKAFVTALHHAESPLDTRVSGWLVESERLLAQGQQQQAKSALVQASRLAGAERLRRPFLEAPVRVRALIREDQDVAGQLNWLGTTNANGICRQPRAAGGANTSTHTNPIVVPLTGKEKEVLAHLADLLTTEEMAAAMFVSVNTIRTHVRNIMRKLSASRRNEAVRRARELDLLTV